MFGFDFDFVELRMADEVTIQNCPPISARKRFKLFKVLQSPEKEREERHRLEGEALKRAAAVAAAAASSDIGHRLAGASSASSRW